jgi:hypothetical protein
MEFSWDESKREWVLAERGIDFCGLPSSCSMSVPAHGANAADDEERFLSVGLIGGKFFAVVWTWRDDAVRIITARRARDEEEKRYRALYG